MTEPRVSEPMWGGVTDRECDEHRTTGQRAWCFDCREWCYPATPCRGCETSWLRQRIAELEAENTLLRQSVVTYDEQGETIGAWTPVEIGRLAELEALETEHARLLVALDRIMQNPGQARYIIAQTTAGDASMPTGREASS